MVGAALRLGLVVVLFVGATLLVMWSFSTDYSLELMSAALLVTIGMLPVVTWALSARWLKACGADRLANSWFSGGAHSWDVLVLRQIQLAGLCWLCCFGVKRLPIAQLGLEDPFAMMASAMAITCLCLAAFSTQWAGGARYRSWRFYQPLAGGAAFVVLQGVSWTVLGVSLFLLGLNLLCHLARIFNLACLSCIPAHLGALSSLSSATGLGLASEVLLAASLCVYSSGDKRPPRPSYFSSYCIGFAFCFFICKPELVLFGLALISLRLIAPIAGLPGVLLLWLASGLWYASTYARDSHTSGRRAWPAAQRWLKEQLFDKYFVPFFSLKLLTSAKLQPDSRYIFGFHPHGIVPTTACWAPLTSKWADRFPGVTPAALTSTVIHSIPFARDLAQFCSGYDVSRVGFSNALEHRKSVLLIPGGQYEMIDSSSRSNTVTINSRHRGFVRMALTLGAALIPIYSFGEARYFDNLPFPRQLQLWFMKTVRANLLTFPYGAWLICPRRVPISLAVADPLPLLHVPEPSELQVALLHRRYFTELELLFHRHKVAAGHPDEKIKFTAEFERISPDEFDRAWRDTVGADGPKAAESPPVSPNKPSGPVATEIYMCAAIMLLIPMAALLVGTPA